MKTYTVTVSVDYDFIVEAETEKEAEELAVEKYHNSAEVGEVVDVYCSGVNKGGFTIPGSVDLF